MKDPNQLYLSFDVSADNCVGILVTQLGADSFSCSEALLPFVSRQVFYTRLCSKSFLLTMSSLVQKVITRISCSFHCIQVMLIETFIEKRKFKTSNLLLVHIPQLFSIIYFFGFASSGSWDLTTGQFLGLNMSLFS